METEARRRLQRDLSDAQGLAEGWAGRVAADPAQLDLAVTELLGDEAQDEAGLLAALGLRPEALSAWKERTLEQLLRGQLAGDPAVLLVDLDAGRWQDALPESSLLALREDAGDRLARRETQALVERTQQGAGRTLALSAEIAEGKAGRAEIRQAENDGSLSVLQAEILRREAAAAGVAAQARQMANDELALSLTGGTGFDAANPQNRAAADAFYETAYSAAVREGADEATFKQIAAAVGRTGYAPKGLTRDVTAALQGSNADRQVSGARLYGRLLESVPEVLARSLDLETRARGGVLSRWLAAGLEPKDALARAEAELPRDGGVRIFDDDTTAVLQRDLGSLFSGAQSGHRVGRILDQLERNYLDDLGRGLIPRQARAQAQRDLGRVMNRLMRLNSALEQLPGVVGQSGDRSPSLLHLANGAVLPAPFPLPIPPQQADLERSAAAARVLQRDADDLVEYVGGANDEAHRFLMEQLARISPALAAELFGVAMQSIGDGENLLGEIQSEDERTGIRSVRIDHRKHGWMTIRQRKDITTGEYYNLDVTFHDPETGKEVTERLPSSRFALPPESGGDFREGGNASAGSESIGADDAPNEGDLTRVVPGEELIPDILPGPIPQPRERFDIPPSRPGEGREHLPNHTGGDAPNHDVLTEPNPGFPVHDQDVPNLVSPDQTGKFNHLNIVYNEEGTPIYDGIPISERFIHRAGNKHDKVDIWYDEKGYPIFDEYVIETVEIELTGSRGRDKRIASKKALEKGVLTSIPEGYVWHHHQDMKTMQLLPCWLHKLVGHTGGMKNLKKGK
jgi:hypothetical protein